MVPEPAPVAAKPKPKPKPRGPKAKKCLPPPSGDGLGDEGVTASQGLSMSEVKGALGGGAGVLECVEDKGTGRRVRFETTVIVGCNGLVSSAVVSGDGVRDSEIACVERWLRGTAFPAHDLPDGFEFQHPFTYSE